jgi:hypothetical protein
MVSSSCQSKKPFLGGGKLFIALGPVRFLNCESQFNSCRGPWFFQRLRIFQVRSDRDLARGDRSLDETISSDGGRLRQGQPICGCTQNRDTVSQHRHLLHVPSLRSALHSCVSPMSLLERLSVVKKSLLISVRFSSLQRDHLSRSLARRGSASGMKRSLSE